MKLRKNIIGGLLLIAVIMVTLVWGTTTETNAATKYTISYNANGGSGAPSNQTKEKGTTLVLSSVKPTRTGYTFEGWATSSSSNTVKYKAGDSYTKNASVTLYAVWKIKTYTVTYNANGGSGIPSSQIKTHGVDLTLSSTRPSRSGYSFQGWATSASSTVVKYSPGEVYSKNANVTLYAIWKAKTYTVSYNANGGSGAPSNQIKTYNVSLKLSSIEPTRTGYTFQGWATNSTATTPKYLAGGSYTANSNATLYAVWKVADYSEVVKNYFTCMDYSIDAFTEYTGKDRSNVAVQFYLWALGRDIGSSGLFHIGIDGVIGTKTISMLSEEVGTTDINLAIPLLKDKLVPILESRNVEWLNIVRCSGSKLAKTSSFPLEDPKYLVFFQSNEESQIDPIFAGRLAFFGKSHQIPVFVQAGFRSYEVQAQRYKESGGKLIDGVWTGGDGSAAVPGSSWHEFGEAIDTYNLNITCTNLLRNTMYSDVAATSQQTELTDKGLYKPMTAGNNSSVKEAWHVQPYNETVGIYGTDRIPFYEAYSGKNYKIVDPSAKNMLKEQVLINQWKDIHQEDLSLGIVYSIDADFEENHVEKKVMDILREKNIIRVDNVGEDGSQLGFVSNEGLTYVFSDDGMIAYIMCDSSVTLNGAHGGQSFEEIMELLGANQIQSYCLSEDEVYYYLDYYYGNIKYRFRSLNDETGRNCVLIGINARSDSLDAMQIIFEIGEHTNDSEGNEEIESIISSYGVDLDMSKDNSNGIYLESLMEEICEITNPVINEEGHENE